MERKEEKKFRKITRYGNSLRSNKGICFYCSCSLDTYSRTVDHLIPASKGGIRSNDNKVYSCRRCNQLKSNMTPEEFIEFLNRMISFEVSSSKERIGYLRKVSINVERLINGKNDRHKNFKKYKTSEVDNRKTERPEFKEENNSKL